jgi:cellulose synthase/poly-beta-1,6-N-acetylglucosamine synthase-like glycosyltransferase
VRTAVEIIGLASTIYAAALNLSYFMLLPLARRGMTRTVRRRGWSWHEEAFASPLTPGISIVVPAFNEETVILESVASLLAQQYSLFEVVIVDDGSTDATAQKLIDAYGLRQVEPAPRHKLQYEQVTEMYRSPVPHNLTLVRKHNGGRADALNAGLDVARHPYVCITDADSIIDPNGLTVMVRPVLEDPERVIAVGGTIRVGNSCRIESGRVMEARLPSGRLAAYQVIEYLRAFLFGRVAWDAIGALVIVSGAFGLFRRDVIDEVGGYWTETVGEDLELTVRLHRHMRDSGLPYRITYAPDPVCWTEVPSDVGSLGRQRRRWHRGLWECLWRHRSMMLRRRYGTPGMVALPYFLAFEFCGPLMEAAAWIAFPIGLALGIVDYHLVAAFIFCSWVLGSLVTLVATGLEEHGYRNYRRGRDLGRMMSLAVFENMWFRQMIDLYRLAGMYDIARRKRGWGAMRRTGFQET